MNIRNTTQLIAACALIHCASTSFAHENTPHKAKTSAVVKEQKDWGIAGDAASVKREITLSMGDNMRFTPSTITVKQGETIRFVVKNQGKQLHEMVIGTKKELDAHAALMVKFPGMEHDEPYMAHVAAGKTQNLVWTFNRPGEFEFACLIAGHYQAGMVGRISVLKTQ
ncbi:MAG: plastocyanin [Polaromonas sp.]|nr:MAG: plastocyanin [Polaromonas sp.]